MQTRHAFVLLNFLPIILVLRLEDVPEYLGVGDDLLQELSVGYDGLVYFMQFAFVSQSRQKLLIWPGQLVDILSATIIC